jgi:predicted AAA+ superfamily ATPase
MTIYSPRQAEATLRELLAWYPVVAITGPRQSGKTTLARHLLAEKPYVNLESPDQREYASGDPRGFLCQFPHGAILDEIQNVPALFSYLQAVVDEGMQPGSFVLTGSQQFGLRDGIAQSLAGRVGLLELLPFSLSELAIGDLSLNALLCRGACPRIVAAGIPSRLWLADYLSTYLERDVRRLLNVRDLSSFQRFLRMCAGRSGQLLNLSALAADCGISHNTAREWLSVLEASYIVRLLPPYHRNFGKRLVKTPKLYFLDTGLAAWLMSIASPDDLAVSMFRGPLFETLVVTEILKARLNRRKEGNLYFWRDSNGHEIDLLIEAGGKLVPVECKAGETIAADWFRPLERFRQSAGLEESWIVYGGDAGQTRAQCTVVGWRSLPQLTDELSTS